MGKTNTHGALCYYNIRAAVLFLFFIAGARRISVSKTLLMIYWWVLKLMELLMAMDAVVHQ
jgi:hypothetical protein